MKDVKKKIVDVAEVDTPKKIEKMIGVDVPLKPVHEKSHFDLMNKIDVRRYSPMSKGKLPITVSIFYYICLIFF